MLNETSQLELKIDVEELIADQVTKGIQKLGETSNKPQ